MLIFVTILQVIVGVALAAMILFQSGKNRGLSGAIGGSSDSYLSKGKDTKWVGAAFVILTLVINCMVAAGMAA